MKCEQHNPLPVPSGGALQEVEGTLRSIFDWEYALRRQRLLALYEKLDLLRFESMRDSVEEPETPPPAELVQLMGEMLARSQQPGPAGGA